MLTYDDLAHKLGIPRGTLGRKIKEYNKRAGINGTDKILPDEEQPTKTTLHLFKPERVQEIKQALATLKTRGRGRPTKEIA